MNEGEWTKPNTNSFACVVASVSPLLTLVLVPPAAGIYDFTT